MENRYSWDQHAEYAQYHQLWIGLHRRGSVMMKSVFANMRSAVNMAAIGTREQEYRQNVEGETYGAGAQKTRQDGTGGRPRSRMNIHGIETRVQTHAVPRDRIEKVSVHNAVEIGPK